MFSRLKEILMDRLADIFNQIKTDPENQAYTANGIDPLYFAHPNAKICFIGQAPGIKAQETGLYWNDPSGDRLRQWCGITRDFFYTSDKISIIPMDFYYPGKGKSGDLPPRKDFAQKWHPLLFEQMPNLELYILIGSYAQKYYLNLKSSDKTTEVIKNYKTYLPLYFPMIHPSPRNNIWLARNPWFEEQVIPDLERIVKSLLDLN